MSKLSLIVSQQSVLSFSKESRALDFSIEPNFSELQKFKQLNPKNCSVDELLFSLRGSLTELKKSQSQVNFLAQELSSLMKKPTL